MNLNNEFLQQIFYRYVASIISVKEILLFFLFEVTLKKLVPIY